jgi:hypothetical protein
MQKVSVNIAARRIESLYHEECQALDCDVRNEAGQEEKTSDVE